MGSVLHFAGTFWWLIFPLSGVIAGGLKARAQHLMRLATDSGATPQERQSAYSRARKELDGLIALPAMTRASIERKVAREIQA